MVDAPERLWLSAPNDEHEHEFWFEPSDGGTEYVRADLLIGPCGYLHMPIGLAEDHWSLEFDPSEHPDEVASAPLYMIDPALSDAVAEREAEPVAFPECVLGLIGEKITLVFESPEDARLAFGIIEYTISSPPTSELEALRKRVAELEKALEEERAAKRSAWGEWERAQQEKERVA